MAVPCSHKHTNMDYMLHETFKDKPWILWHGYGIILDVLVHECILMTLTDYLNPLAVCYLISTCQFPQAVELLLPDLLH